MERAYSVDTGKRRVSLKKQRHHFKKGKHHELIDYPTYELNAFLSIIYDYNCMYLAAISLNAYREESRGRSLSTSKYKKKKKYSIDNTSKKHASASCIFFILFFFLFTRS